MLLSRDGREKVQHCLHLCVGALVPSFHLFEREGGGERERERERDNLAMCV